MKKNNSIDTKEDKNEELNIKKVNKKKNQSKKENSKYNNNVSKKEKLKNKENKQKERKRKYNNNQKDKETKEEKKKKSLDYKNYEKVLEKSLKNKKKITIAIGVIIFILSFIIFSVIFSLLNINNNKIFNNIYIQGIDVSGMDPEDAKNRLQEVCKSNSEKEILLKYNEYETTLNTQMIDVIYDINSAVDKAYSIGRKGGIIANNYNILGTLIKKNDVTIDIKINEEEIKKIVSEITQNLPGTIKESGYYIEDNNLIITKGKEGIVVKEDEFIDKIYNKLKKLDLKEGIIEIPIENKKPEEINLEKIKQEIYREAQNAYYVAEPFEIYPEVNGIDFDIEVAKGILQEEKDEYIIPLIITKPEVTLEQIGSEAFPDILGVCTTKYDMSNTARTNNLQIATNKINGKVLLSGEEFSYNAIVGERTITAGYKEAKVYENGQVVDGLGGGICQISSTLYNSVVLSNLEVIQRRNHQFVTSYLPAGKDATVVYGSQDFKFKNIRKYPIKIVASISNGIARIEIRGIKEENEPEISFETHTISTIPYSVKYIDDSNLWEGEEKVQQKGTNGLVTETYKIEKLNGVVTSKTLLSRDRYNAMQKIVNRGTKKQPEQITEKSNASDRDENQKDKTEEKENSNIEKNNKDDDSVGKKNKNKTE